MVLCCPATYAIEDILQAFFRCNAKILVVFISCFWQGEQTIKKSIKTVIYDAQLHIEAYHFQETFQPFPNHFHEYYVIGFVAQGQRYLFCKNQEYVIKQGDTILINPYDNHACVHSSKESFDYRGINISPDVMLNWTEEVTGKRELPCFTPNVIDDKDIACYVRSLHDLIMNGSSQFGKEETLLLLLSMLIEQYGKAFSVNAITRSYRLNQLKKIEKACAFMEQHYAERISLEQICYYAELSKSTLLRAFTQAKGVTPYCYLENIRINKAKKLLKKGCTPVEVALQTGFSDQSHFTNYFSRFIGLTPSVYRDIFVSKDNSKNKL